MKEGTGRMIKKQDKGFTLIEMIVTVSIIAVFGGILLTLVTTGSNLFRGVSGNTKAQVDAQETLDAIEDLLIDANRSVYYAYGDGSNVGAEITNDIESSDSAFKTLLVCNEYENGDGSSRYVVDVLDWDGQEGKLYYSQREYTKASSSETEQETDTDEETVRLQSQEEFQAVPANIDFSDKVRDAKEVVQRSVFAQGIENFTADMTKVEEERIARFRLTTKNNGKEVKTLHTVNLRNQIQVQKPDDAFAEAGSTDVKIKIVGAPEAIQAGTSAILRYELECSGSGSIDPTTVHWEIVNNKEKGYFPEADPTYGKLTIADSADGAITVIVSAVTTDGKTVTSAPVTIKILTTKKVAGIRADKTEFLAAAGYDGLDLSATITWKYIYSDGSEDIAPVNVTWKAKQQYGYASVTSAGQVHIDAEAGMADTGSFEILATDDTYGFSGVVTVKIARIDLLQPSGTYKVGQDRPQAEYIYREAGQILTLEKVLDITNTNMAYQTGENEKFTIEEIGSWEAKVSFDLKDRNGMGTVSSVSSYQVKDSQESDIIINGGNSILAAGSVYYFGYLTTNLQHVYINKTPDYSTEECDLTWSIKGNYDSSTCITKQDKKVSYVTIGEQEKGFVLSVEMRILNNRNENEVLRTYRSSLNVKIAHPELELVGLPEIVQLEETYSIGVNAIVTYITDPDSDGPYTYTEERIAVKQFTNKSIGGTSIGDTWKVDIRYNHAGEKTRELRIDAQEIPGLLKAQSWKVFEVKRKEVKIADPQVEVIIHEKNGRHKLNVGDSVEFWAVLRINGNDVTNTDYKLWWEGLWEYKTDIAPGEHLSKDISAPWDSTQIQAKLNIFGVQYVSQPYAIQFGGK